MELVAERGVAGARAWRRRRRVPVGEQPGEDLSRDRAAVAVLALGGIPRKVVELEAPERRRVDQVPVGGQDGDQPEGAPGSTPARAYPGS